MHIYLRQASIEDAALLTRLNHTVQKLHAEHMPERYKLTTPDDPQVVMAFEHFLCDENAYAFIADVDGIPAGYVCCKITLSEENAYIYTTTSLHIDQMSVNEVYQRQGIGHALIERVFVLARQLGIPDVTLGVTAFNQNAQHFYQQHGFEPITMRMRATVS
jgi:ribosomal protein S18 acetylase RimI-like enzyme